MPSMNQYNKLPVALDGGLDLINPKITVPSGSISGDLNFERTDRVGYSRINGMERFDGGMAPSLAYTNLIYLVHTTATPLAQPRAEIFISLPDTTNGPVLGCVVTSTALKTLVAITNFDQWRLVQKAIADATTITLNVKNAGDLVVTGIISFNDNFPLLDAAGQTAQRNAAFISMRNFVTDPGNPDKPVIGLHGFKDQLYAVKDLNVLKFNSGGTNEVYANDTVRPNGGTADDDVRILDVLLISGTWAGGTAAGYFLVDTGDTPIIPSAAWDIIRPITTKTNQFDIIAGTTIDAWQAGMYVSASYDQAMELTLDEGWNSVEMGFALGFEDGQSTGPFRVARRGEFSDFATDEIETTATGTVGSTSDSTYAAVPVPGDTWTLQGAGTVPLCLQTNSLGAYIRRTINNADPNVGYVPGNIYISDFPAFTGFSSSSSVVVSGVEVTVVARPIRLDDTIRTYSLAVQPVTGNTTLQTGTSSQSQSLVVNYGGPPAEQDVQTLTFGGATDLWGLDAATMKAGMDSGWGMAIQPWVQIVAGSRVGIIDVIYCSIKVFYTATVSAYYFYNGVDDVTADITNYFVTDGDWSTNDAEGTLQVTNIEPVGSADRRSILAGDEIRTDPNGGGLLIATVTADQMVFNGLDTLADIEDAESRYQFITENFFADADFEGMYGVSGAGRAFAWDGFYFIRIYTQEDDAKDVPRHITSHQFHLVLGYEAGANLLSVAGNPFDFDGVHGAVEIDTGDPIRGYARMNGTTLGIFCSKTIQGLIGTSPDNFSLSVLSPYEGAREYMVADIGKPVYLSYRGISLFQQTAAYGDFSGSRMSYAITPFLIPRIQGQIAPLDTIAASKGPVALVPCRTKNQLHLIFGDGYISTMTLAGPEQTPMFTTRAYQLMSNDDTEFLGYFVPRAETSFVDSAGAEHIFMAPYSTSVDMPAYHVYEFEKSWTFDGSGIPAYFITNENFYGPMFDFDTSRKLRVHGLSYGYAPLFVRFGANYDPNDSTVQVPREALDISLPRAPATVLGNDYAAVTNKTDPAKRGISFSARFMSYDFTDTTFPGKDPIRATVCPPFVVQAMLAQYTEDKGDV